MDKIIIVLLVVILIGIAAILYACCISSKIDRLAELEDIDAELEKLKEKNYMKIIRRKNK